MGVAGNRRVRRTAVMTAGLLAFVLGAGFAKLGYGVPGWVVMVCGALMALTMKQSRGLLLLTAIAFGFSLGWWRGAGVQRQLQPYRTAYGHKVIFTATATTDAIYGDHSQLSFDVGSIKFIEPTRQSVPGVITIKGFGESAVDRGDTLHIEGKLQSTLGGKQGRMSYAAFTTLGHHTNFIDTVRRKFGAGLISAVPEPLASFGLGLLIGQRNTLPANITLQLSAIGLSHIVAVSGYNLTIIIEAMRKLLGKRSKYQGTVLSLLLIVGFLLVTGLSASIVRAAIVSSLSLWAWYYGRSFPPLLLIALSAVITVAWNPLYVWGDIGWYLSFLAFVGVVVLCPLVTRRLYGPRREPRMVASVVIESLCAQIVTAPLILYVFHQTSLVSLPSNVLLVPLVPLGMLLAFVAGLAGMLIGPICGWFAWPARLLLTYMLDAISLLARVPHASVKRDFSLMLMLLSYLLVAVVCVMLLHKTRSKYAIVGSIETTAMGIDSS